MMQLIIDHLWQSTLFGIAAWFLTFALRSNTAAVRYWVWFAASVKFLIPFALLSWLGEAIAPQVPVSFPAVLIAMDVIAAPAAPAATQSLAPGLIVFWGMGSLVIAALWLRRYLRVAGIVRAASPAHLDAPLPVKLVARQVEPSLIGVWRPVLLLPSDLIGLLKSDELASVIAHEVSHFRRRDNLTATIHMAVQVLFWFHPLVWWIGGKLVEERERACDEAVVASGSDAGTYAEAILKVCRFYVRSPMICAAGVSGADLKQRIEEIMTRRKSTNLSSAKKFVLASVALAAVVSPIILGWARAPITSAVAAAPSDVIIPPKSDPNRPNRGAEQIYPPESKAAREEGTAVLLLTVDATGDVVAAKVDTSSGHERLDAAAHAVAMDHWRFLPGTRNGKPEQMQMRIRINFELDPPPAKPK